MDREFKCCAGPSCCAGCCDCCAHEITVTAANGEVMGYVKQAGSWYRPRFQVLDENHQPVLRVEGPWCLLDGPCCPCDSSFKLMPLSGDQELGSLKKLYAGFVNEMVTTADRFSIQCKHSTIFMVHYRKTYQFRFIQVPLDLHVKVKATLIGALFLIVSFLPYF